MMDTVKSPGNISLSVNMNDELESVKKNLESEEHVSWKDIKPQILFSNIGFLFTIHAGVNLAFSNLLLEEFDTEVSSWCASIVGLSTPLGTCISGALMDRIGRKKTNMLIAVPCNLSWLLTMFVRYDQLWLLYSARFLSGIAGGMATANMVYVSEISHKNYRPVMLSLLSVHFSLGILITTVLKAFFNWRQNALLYLIFFSVVLVLVMIYTNETPIWLINFRGDWNRAKVSLRKLYTNPKVFENEWNYLVQSTKCTDKSAHRGTLNLSQPYVYKPIIYLLILFLLQQMSGIYVSILYAIQIFPTVSPHYGEILKNETFVLTGIVRFLTSVAGSFMSIRVGRKTLLHISSVSMLISCVIIVGSMFVSYTEVGEIIIVTGVLLFIGAGSFGVMNIPWSLTVEILPTEVKSIGSTLLISYSYLLMSVLAKIFPKFLLLVNVYWVFTFFGFISLLLAIFVHFCIPETLGKTFKEIENFF